MKNVGQTDTQPVRFLGPPQRNDDVVYLRHRCGLGDVALLLHADMDAVGALRTRKVPPVGPVEACELRESLVERVHFLENERIHSDCMRQIAAARGVVERKIAVFPHLAYARVRGGVRSQDDALVA